MCRHIYDWNIVNCDVKQPIQKKSKSEAADLWLLSEELQICFTKMFIFARPSKWTCSGKTAKSVYFWK